MDKTADLAVVQLEVPPGRRLPVAEIGRSSTLRAGEFVVAMGSPMGLVETCPLGIVSAVARRKSDLCELKKKLVFLIVEDFVVVVGGVGVGGGGGGQGVHMRVAAPWGSSSALSQGGSVVSSVARRKSDVCE